MLFRSENQNDNKRYDLINITVNDYFENSIEGFWTYEIYEQLDDADLSVENKNKVESGLMYLHPTDTYEPSKYNDQSTHLHLACISTQ